MTIDEYKKSHTMHVSLPSGLEFDCKAPGGILVARWQERISILDPETQGLQAMDMMLEEFEGCLPEGLQIEDLTAEDYAALIGIVSPFFEQNPFPSLVGLAKPSESDTSNLDSGPTTT